VPTLGAVRLRSGGPSAGPGSLYRALQTIRFLIGRDRRGLVSFLAPGSLGPLDRRARLALIARFLRITHAVPGYHTLAEWLTITTEILSRAGSADLTVVEAGCGYGASTANLLASTRTGLVELYPRLTPGGVILSLDGQLAAN